MAIVIRVMHVGYFITFEGVEGCGKTTQIKLLAGLLSEQGFDSLLTREPGGCPISDKIRTILLDAENRVMSPLAELMLYGAARAQHVSEVIAPGLGEGKIVLCDRFCDATVAYQSFGRGIERSVIDTLNLLACQGVTPNLTVLFDCDPAIGLKRARLRIETTSGPREERFELEELAFHQRVRAGYLQLATDQPERFLIVDASESIDAISTIIAAQLLARIPETLRAVC
jgi:dTMP kinase